MKIDLKTCTEEELWKYVAVHLKKNGIDTILVGGAVVAIYTKSLYDKYSIFTKKKAQPSTAIIFSLVASFFLIQ